MINRISFPQHTHNPPAQSQLLTHAAQIHNQAPQHQPPHLDTQPNQSNNSSATPPKFDLSNYMSSRKVNDDVLIVDWPWVLKLTDMPLKPNGHEQPFKCPCGGVTKIGSWNSWLGHSMKQSCRQALSHFLYYDGNMTVNEIMNKGLPSPLKGSDTSNKRFLHQNTNQTASTIARQRQHYTHTSRSAEKALSSHITPIYTQQLPTSPPHDRQQQSLIQFTVLLQLHPSTPTAP